MTTYNVTKHLGSEKYEWAFCELLALLTSKKIEAIKPEKVEVLLFIDGHEVNFLKFVDRFFDQVEHIAKVEAEMIVAEKIGSILDAIEEMRDIANDKLTALTGDLE